MRKYIIKRLLLSLVILFFVAFIIYALMRSLPTSYLETIARQKSMQPGSKTFEEWMKSAATAESLIERIKKEFRLGGHKAAAIALVLQKAEIMLVSELEDDFVRSVFLTPKHSVQEALDDAFRKLGPEATVLSMPYGGSTLPMVVGS